MIVSSAFLFRNANNMADMSKVKETLKFDNNQDIAFDQIMAKIYSDAGKEYSIDNTEIKKEFLLVIDSFAKGACIGFKRTCSAKLTHKKMIQIIDNSTDGVADAFNLGLLLGPIFKL